MRNTVPGPQGLYAAALAHLVTCIYVNHCVITELHSYSTQCRTVVGRNESDTDLHKEVFSLSLQAESSDVIEQLVLVGNSHSAALLEELQGGYVSVRYCTFFQTTIDEAM